MSSPTLPALPPIDRLASCINAAHRRCLTAAQATIEIAADIGRMLIEAKAAIPHGEFTAWINEHLECGPRQARRYMQVHRRLGKSDARDRFDSIRSLLTDDSATLDDDGRLLERRIIAAYNEAIRVMRDDEMPDVVRIQQLDLILLPLDLNPEKTQAIFDRWRADLDRPDITLNDAIALHDRAVQLHQPIAYFNLLLAVAIGQGSRHNADG